MVSMIRHLLWTAIDQLWSNEGMISYKQCILIQEMAHGHGSHGQQKFRRISRLQISCQSFQVNQFISKQNKYSRNATLMLCRIIIKSLSLFYQRESRQGSFEFFLWLLLFQDWVACQFPLIILAFLYQGYLYIPSYQFWRGGEKHDPARRPWIQNISLTRVQPVTSHPDPNHLQRSGQDIHCNKCLDKGWYVELDIISLLMIPSPMNDLNQQLHADILRNFKLEKLRLTSLFQWTDSD